MDEGPWVVFGKVGDDQDPVEVFMGQSPLVGSVNFDVGVSAFRTLTDSPIKYVIFRNYMPTRDAWRV